MAFIPVPATLQANVRFSLDGQQIENVLHFSWVGGSFATASVAVYGILDLEWWSALRQNLSNGLVSVETYMVDLSSASAGVATFPAFENPAGNVPVDSVPNNSALCITHRTASRGRSFRGRTYISGIPESITTRSRIAGPNAIEIADAFNALRVAADAANVPFMIVSRYTNNAPRVAGLRTPVELSLVIDNVLDSQRRRLPGRGR